MAGSNQKLHTFSNIALNPALFALPGLLFAISAVALHPTRHHRHSVSRHHKSEIARADNTQDLKSSDHHLIGVCPCILWHDPSALQCGIARVLQKQLHLLHRLPTAKNDDDREEN